MRRLRSANMAETILKEVLIVEDEALIRIMAADALADRGIMAWEAADANEALTALAEHPLIGLMFTDVNMPGKMNGLDLAHEVSTARPDMELIVTSSAGRVADEDLPHRGTFLPKPYSTEQMLNTVAQKLGSSEAGAE